MAHGDNLKPGKGILHKDEPNGGNARGDQPGGEKDFSGYDADDHEAAGDAETLRRAEEIKMDKNRHSKAVGHLAHQKQVAVQAHANARRSLLKKTGTRLKQAFGPNAAQDQDEPDVEYDGKGDGE